MRFPRTLIVLALVLSAACPGAQVKGGTGDGVSMVLRRVDVVKADFDRLTLQVIVAVENGGNSDADVAADVTLAMVGAAAERSDEEGQGDQIIAPSQTAPIDGVRHVGMGAGRAAAFNTSELPITIEVPLPADPTLLEQVLEWPKMLVYIEGSVRVGLATIPLSGHREIAPPHLPTVKLKEAQVASVDDGRAGTGFFTIVLENKNPFPVTVDKMSWTVSIKDKALQPSSGVLEVERDTVPASAVGEYQTEVQVNEEGFGKELKAILKSPTVPYLIEGTLEVRGIKRSFRFAGDMKFAR